MSLNPETCLQEEGCKDRAYKKVTLEECTEAQTHLSAEERQAFKEDLETDTDGFDGRLGCYSHTKINIRLKPSAKPVHMKHYPVRWVNDFRALNKLIERPQYPLPRIHESMLKHKGYKHFMKIIYQRCSIILN